jgi:phosphoglycerate dehydrogenase-like enzyme
MKRGALFFNLGRGQVVDEEALVRALQEGRIGGAGLDVFDQEPLPRSSPLWTMQNVIVSPHVGGVSDHTRERGAHLFAVNLARFLEGRELLNVVDRSGGY